MKLVCLLSTAMLILGPAISFAQSTRLDNQLDHRLGGKLNAGQSGTVRGASGPDPYVGPGSISPFARSPLVPMPSAPVQETLNPYAGRYPSVQGGSIQEPSVSTEGTERTPSVLLQGQSSTEESGRTRASAKPSDQKIGGQLKEERSLERSNEKMLPEERTQPKSLVKQQPCVNGRTRTTAGDCSGPLRPRPK